MTNPNALPIGAILQSQIRTYRVVEVLGSGSFGITYKVMSTIMVDNVDKTLTKSLYGMQKTDKP